MLKFLRRFGIDLERDLHHVLDLAQARTGRLVDQVKSPARKAAIALGLAWAGTVITLITIVIALIWLFAVIDARVSENVAFLAIFIVSAAVAGLLFSLAAKKWRETSSETASIASSTQIRRTESIGREHRSTGEYMTRSQPPPAMPQSSRPAMSSSHFSGVDLRTPLASAVRSVLAEPPHTDGPLDDVIKSVTTQAATVSDEVVEASADLLRTGSRTTLISVLTAAALVGFMIGRKGQLPRFL